MQEKDHRSQLTLLTFMPSIQVHRLCQPFLTAPTFSIVSNDTLPSSSTMSTVVTVPERSLARGNCLPNMFAALTINIACQPGPQQPDLYHTGGLGVTAALGSRKMSFQSLRTWWLDFPWRVRFGGLLWVANYYKSWVYDDVFIWLMLTIDLCYQFYGLMIVRRKEKHKDPKLRYWRVVFHLPFSLGSMPQVLGSARLLLCLQSDLEWHYQIQMGCPAVWFNWIGDTSCAKELL